MLKKRLIFVLLYDQGEFMLSRNFRLQRVGNIDWLEKNYNFSKTSSAIDELLVLDVTRGERESGQFCSALRRITKGCFIPVAAGGGIRDVGHAYQLLRSGADKIVVNTALHQDRPLVAELSRNFGQQAMVGSVDLRRATDGSYQILVQNGSQLVPGDAVQLLAEIASQPIGEVYLNSIDRDGTGHGLDMELVNMMPPSTTQPVILAGGVGSSAHLDQGLANSRVDAVATANLFNFVGDGLMQARRSLIAKGTQLPVWMPI